MILEEELEMSREIKLLSFMIMSDDVCEIACRRYRSNELKSNYFSGSNKRIFQWVVKYYQKMGKAPKSNIQSIWEHKKRILNKEQIELIESTLEYLAISYVEFEEEGYDEKDIVQFDLTNFIREKELTDRIEKAQDLIQQDRLDKAAEVFKRFEDVQEDEVEDENLGIIEPFTEDDLLKSNVDDQSEDYAYQFDGDLGDLIGPLRRSWLVAITATEKAGKSYFIDDIGYDAVFYQNKKVLKINLELSEPLQRLRMQKRISRTCDSYQAGQIVYPVLDCENNQWGTCLIPKQKRVIERRKKNLFYGPEDFAVYTENRTWTPCTDCLRNPDIRKNAHQNKRFIPTIWFDRSRVNAISKRLVRKSIKRFRKNNLKNFRVKCFPRFSRTFEEIRSYILRYIDKSNWIPDIIILDYLDITGNTNPDPRLDVDKKWKQASQLAGELNCLILNADQATKVSRTAYQLDQMSTSESKTKDAHLDVRIGLNQKGNEKLFGVARINVIFHRHHEFSPTNEVMITQRLHTSEAMIENARIFGGERKWRISPEFIDLESKEE